MSLHSTLISMIEYSLKYKDTVWPSAVPGNINLIPELFYNLINNDFQQIIFKKNQLSNHSSLCRQQPDQNHSEVFFIYLGPSTHLSRTFQLKHEI